MQVALKKGGPETLNSYFMAMKENLGVAFFDGIINHYATLPGVDVAHAFSEYVEGDTMVHEVGHWLGLPHTFDGGCSIASDGVADTPAEAEAYFGCSPEDNRDTCPDFPGIDPIHNFMDYSDDVCLYEFTAGQMEVMQAFYDYWRPSSIAISLELSIPSDPIDIGADDTQLFKLSTTKCSVVCRTEAVSGDAELFIQLGSAVTFSTATDYCVSDGGDSNEKCSISRSEDAIVSGGFYAAFFSRGGGNKPSRNECENIRINIGVLAYDDVTGLTVTYS